MALAVAVRVSLTHRSIPGFGAFFSDENPALVWFGLVAPLPCLLLFLQTDSMLLVFPWLPRAISYHSYATYSKVHYWY